MNGVQPKEYPYGITIVLEVVPHRLGCPRIQQLFNLSPSCHTKYVINRRFNKSYNKFNLVKTSIPVGSKVCRRYNTPKPCQGTGGYMVRDGEIMASKKFDRHSTFARHKENKKSLE